LVDWASGIHVAVCGDGAFDNVTSSFKSAFAEVLNKFCQNITACRLQRSVAFNPGDIMVLEGYPRREYNGVRIRFVVILPGNVLLPDEQQRPLLPKAVIFSNQNLHDLESRMQMYIVEYERYPRFDAITEFMNTAVIPIGFLLMVIMFGLAYWTSTLTFELFVFLGLGVEEISVYYLDAYIFKKSNSAIPTLLLLVLHKYTKLPTNLFLHLAN
uniref:Guanylate cyclase domain-containing protein n=1 Tax=Enterobius vermicularis TaxID=51028 RepID=A0A0N4VNT5_ENTVE